MGLVALVVTAAACGSSGTKATTTPGDAPGDRVSGGSAAPSTGGGGGGGEATITIGDETWKFTTVRCAFGTDETKNPDWDFSLSAIENGLQLSVSGGAEGGRYGDSIDLDDIEDFRNPSVKWGAPFVELGAPQSGNADFLEIDGTTVEASVDFVDGLDETGANRVGVAGTLAATCP